MKHHSNHNYIGPVTIGSFALALIIPFAALSEDPAIDSKYDTRQDATNSGLNTRDRNPNAVTPFTQSEQEAHVELTRKIRSQITERSDLSTTAQNIKIITDERGDVYLRGPVKSSQERKIINDIALNTVANNSRVFNQLEIAASSN